MERDDTATFMERLWRSVKYEEVYLKAYENGREAKAGLIRENDVDGG